MRIQSSPPRARSGPDALRRTPEVWRFVTLVRRSLRLLGAKVPLLLASVLLMEALPASAAEPSREDRIKAAIVYKVGKFIDWPASVLSTTDGPLRLCLLGEDGFARALSGVAGRTVQGHRVDFSVVAGTRASELAECHILFLPRSASGLAGTVIRRLAGTPVLTISDIPGFAHTGGMISLVRRGNRIGFEIDARAASESGLVVRAQLLDLADIVER